VESRQEKRCEWAFEGGPNASKASRLRRGALPLSPAPHMMCMREERTMFNLGGTADFILKFVPSVAFGNAWDFYFPPRADILNKNRKKALSHEKAHLPAAGGSAGPHFRFCVFGLRRNPSATLPLPAQATARPERPGPVPTTPPVPPATLLRHAVFRTAVAEKQTPDSLASQPFHKSRATKKK